MVARALGRVWEEVEEAVSAQVLNEIVTKAVDWPVISVGHAEAFGYLAEGTLGERVAAASESRSLKRLERVMPDRGMVPLWVTLK